MENASDDFPQQKKLENVLPDFAGSSPPTSPKTSPTSLWKSLVLNNAEKDETMKTMNLRRFHRFHLIASSLHGRKAPSRQNPPSRGTRLTRNTKSLSEVNSNSLKRFLVLFQWNFQDKAFAETREGIYLNKFLGEIREGFLVDFWGTFSLEEEGGKNPWQNSNQNLRALRPKSTLQESGLEEWHRFPCEFWPL